jgi:hypothetical protein
VSPNASQSLPAKLSTKLSNDDQASSGVGRTFRDAILPSAPAAYHAVVPRSFLAVAFACAAALVTARPAMADAAPPIVPGDPVGVPSGAVRDVFIEHEDLTMDLSSMNTATDTYAPPAAAVLARYSLRNDGAAKGIDLVFVTASQHVSGVQVVLDGQTVAANVGPLGPIPSSWMPPTGTPAPQGGPDVPYSVDRPAGLTFHIELSAGRHTMVTSYQALPTQTTSSAYEPHYWQLAFVLSPARQWEGFGDLAVTVRVPAGWPAAVRPGLDRHGDVLSGSFSGIPADSFGITTRMPTPTDWSSAAENSGLAAVLLLCAIAGWFFARPTRWPGLIFAAPILAVVPAALFFAALQTRYYSIPSGQMSWSGLKLLLFEQVGQALVVFIEGTILSQVALFVGVGAWAAWRRRLRVRPGSSASRTRP